MSDQPNAPAGPDLAGGIPLTSLADGAMLAGHVGDDAVLLARVGEEIFAVGATCTHYGGPLAEGIMDGAQVRCPWHHACFSLRTGDVVRTPALRPIPRWEVERRDDRIFVGKKIEPRDPELGGSPAPVAGRAKAPASVVIVGAGAAGSAAADTLRREGYTGPIILLDGDTDAPYDRPNLSKDYLAGNAPEEWIPLRSADAYREHGIELRRGPRATGIDVGAKRLTLSDGSSLSYDALLIATGATPARLPGPSGNVPRVHYLRTLADSRRIIAAASKAKTAVVIGASVIGLEVAASLRARGLEVHVVAPEQRPLERVLGPELGGFVRKVHEEHGVVFHLGRTAGTIDDRSVTLDDGTVLGAYLVVAGVGVRADLELATAAGVAEGRGVPVNECL
ncbi:MAG: FAD-dependent oxidoreductase, partial [Gemmatimonadaceae bacterium]|nr:FAD-dependent oxidoreductase [Gemmatimonadaceae bacterium]